MTFLGLLLSNTLNFTYKISNLSKNFPLFLFLSIAKLQRLFIPCKFFD